MPWWWLLACSVPAPRGTGTPSSACNPRPPALGREVIALSNIAQLVESGTLCDPAATGLVTALHAASPTALLAGRRDDDAVLWDLSTGLGQPLSGSGEIVGVASADDGTLFTGSAGGYVQAWDPTPPFPVRWTARPSWGPTWGIAPLPGGEVVVGSNTGTLARLDATGVVVASARGWRMIWGVEVGPDSELLVSETLGGLHRVRADTLADLGIRQSGLAWQADVNAAGDIAIASDGHAVIVDGSGRHLVAPGRGTVRQVAWSPDGTLLALGTWSGDVIVLETATRDKLWETPANPRRVQTVAWSPDATWLAAGGDGGVVQLWSVRSLPGASEPPGK
jgi:WD40 repeat protein